MKETLSWDLPIPDEVKKEFQVIYTRKLNGERCMMCHDFSNGYDFILSPASLRPMMMEDADCFIMTDKQKELREKYLPLLNNYYIGDQVAVTKDYPISHLSRISKFEMTMRSSLRECFIESYDDGIVFRLFRFTAHVPNPGEISTEKEVQRVFVSNGSVWSEYPVAPGVKWIWEKKNIKAGFSNLLYRYRGSMYCHERIEEKLFSHFPLFKVAGEPREWFRFFPTVWKDNKFNRKADQLNGLVNNQIPAEILDYFSKQNTDTEYCATPHNYFYLDRIKSYNYSYFEELNDKSSVIRMFTRGLNKEIFEYARLFIADDNIYPCYFNHGVVSECRTLHPEFWGSLNSISVKVNNTILAKRCPWIENKNSGMIGLSIINIVKTQSFEDLGKMGFEDFVMDISSGYKSNQNWKEYLRSVNCTKNSSMRDVLGPIKIKRLAWMTSDYSADIFRKAYDLVNRINIQEKEFYCYIAEMQFKNSKQIDMFNSIIYAVEKVLSGRQMLSFEKKIFDQLNWINDAYDSDFIRYNEENDGPFGACCCVSSTFTDMYRLIAYVHEDDAKAFKENIKKAIGLRDMNEIRKFHDKLSSVKRLKSLDMTQFNEMCSQHKDIEFADSDFTIRLPNSPEEIIDEGSSMHHCVASYLSAITSGRSVIAFLRKNSDPDASFITIELNSENKLKQVKCRFNYLVDDEDTLNFLTNWKKAKGIIPATPDVFWKDNKFVCVGQDSRIAYPF